MPASSPTPQVSLCQHRERSIIAVRFGYDPELTSRFRKLPGACWSQTLRIWYLPDTAAYRERFGIAKEAPDSKEDTVLKRTPAATLKDEVKNHLSNPNSSEETTPHMNAKVLAQVRQHLILKGYSLSTQRTYLAELSSLLKKTFATRLPKAYRLKGSNSTLSTAMRY